MKYIIIVLLALCFVQSNCKSDADAGLDFKVNNEDQNLDPLKPNRVDPENHNESTTNNPITTITPEPPTNITTTAIPPVTTVAPNSTTVAPNTTTTTTSPITTVPSTTPKPNSTTSAPTVKPTEQPSPPPTTAVPHGRDREFDGPSFIGGIILACGLTAIGFVAFKFYKARTERNYHTLDLSDEIKMDDGL